MAKLTAAPVYRPANADPQAAYVPVDLGNSLLKGMHMGAYHTCISIPHAIQRPSADKFASMQARMKRGYKRGAGSERASFKYRRKVNGNDYTTYNIIGSQAEGAGQEPNRRGGPKYEPDYYGALFTRMLSELLPDGHDNIIVMAAFPPGDVRFIDDLTSALGGTHYMEFPDGGRVKYKVRRVATNDEPVGGLWNFRLSKSGLGLQEKLPEGNGVIFDIGGKISNVVEFDSEGWVNYNTAVSVDLGIIDIANDLSAMILSEPAWKKHFSSLRNDTLPHNDKMRDAIANGVYNVSGYGLNVGEMLQDAIKSFQTALREVYQDRLGGDRAFDHVVITGGGGAALQDHLKGPVIQMNPNRVYMAHTDMNRMHFANLQGLNKIMMNMVNAGDL